MSHQTRAAGISFLLSLLVVGAVSVSARYFYDTSKAAAAEAEAQVMACI